MRNHEETLTKITLDVLKIKFFSDLGIWLYRFDRLKQPISCKTPSSLNHRMRR
jgi:hypothetical protein